MRAWAAPSLARLADAIGIPGVAVAVSNTMWCAADNTFGQESTLHSQSHVRGFTSSGPLDGANSSLALTRS